MKNGLFFLFPAVLLLVACNKPQWFSNDFYKSQTAWLSFKKSSKNSYQYTTFSSSWTGFNTATTITVHNGVVIKRAYKAEMVYPEPKMIEAWEEEPDQLNSHSSGAGTLTLDEIYEKAKTEWLIADTRENQVFFETKNNGMISKCGYVPRNCADDCFFGIQISGIKPL